MGEKSRDNMGASIEAGIAPGAVGQVVSFSAATSSSAFQPSTKFLRIVATGNCHISFDGDDATTSNSFYLPSGVVEYVGVNPRGTLSVIDA
jgi:hypothetical protein